MRRNVLVVLLAGICFAMVSSALTAPVTPTAKAVGSVSIAAQVPITLYGDGFAPGNGWGRTSGSITQPGPEIRVNQSDTITFSLFSADSQQHRLQIEDSRAETSPIFASSTSAFTWTWNATQAGSFRYICTLHGAGLQSGTLIVVGPAPGDNTLLIVGGVVGVLAVVGIAVVAMRMRGKSKPPTQPPTQ